MNINPNDPYLSYQQQSAQQMQMQMQNYNSSMAMQSNFPKGMNQQMGYPNMPMNRQNQSMNQYQQMQYPNMGNAMGQIPGGIPNPMSVPQNMMKQQPMMMQPPAPYGYSNRSSMPGQNAFNPSANPSSMIPPQMMTTQPSVPQQPTSSKKKKSSNANISSSNSSLSIAHSTSNNSLIQSPENPPSLPTGNQITPVSSSQRIPTVASAKSSSGKVAVVPSINNNMNPMNGINPMNQMAMGMNPMNPMNMGMGMNGMQMAGMNGMMNGMGQMNPLGIQPMPSLGGIPSMNSLGSINPMASMGNLVNPTGFETTATSGSTMGLPNGSQASQNPSMTNPIIPQVSSKLLNQMTSMQNTASTTNSTSPLIQKDLSRIENLLKSLQDDKELDLFTSLFNFSFPGKKKDEKNNKIIAFRKYISTSFPPNWISITLAFLEQYCQGLANTSSNSSITPSSSSQSLLQSPQMPIRSNILSFNMYLKLKDPQIPSVLKRVKSCKPIYKNITLSKMDFNYKDQILKPARKSMIIGSILANETLDPIQLGWTIMLTTDSETVPIQPVKFGENNSYYFIFLPENTSSFPSTFQIQIQPYTQLPPTFLSWFVIQFVQKKKPEEILSQLYSVANRVPLPNEKEATIAAHTSKCKNCLFDPLVVINEILNNGVSKCPICGEDIILNDLIFETLAPETPSIIPIEEDKEMRQCRMVYSDSLLQVSKRHENDWEKHLFDEDGLEEGPYHELQHNNTDEFRNELRFFKS